MRSHRREAERHFVAMNRRFAPVLTPLRVVGAVASHRCRGLVLRVSVEGMRDPQRYQYLLRIL